MLLAQDHVSWSPDGRWLVFTEGDSSIFVVHPDGTGLRPIATAHADPRCTATDDFNWVTYFSPLWRADGRLLFTGSVYCGQTVPPRYSYAVFSIRPDGSGLKRILGPPLTPLKPGESERGIALESIDPAGTSTVYEIMDPNFFLHYIALAGRPPVRFHGEATAWRPRPPK